MKRLLMMVLLVTVAACKQDTRAEITKMVAQLTLRAQAALGSASAQVTPADIAKLRAQAAQGDATAQYNLGVTYHNGTGVVQDDVEAVKWYRLSAA